MKKAALSASHLERKSGQCTLGWIWGHGVYQAPDWSADWLHRKLTIWLDLTAQEIAGKRFDALLPGEQAKLRYWFEQKYRRNTHDANTGTLTVSDRRAQAIAVVADYYQRLYGNDPARRERRDNYAMKDNTLPDPARRENLTNFFFWTAWATATERPGTNATYTNNWPPEPLIGNHPTPENIM